MNMFCQPVSEISANFIYFIKLMIKLNESLTFVDKIYQNFTQIS
jgi:hypothetical protein